MEHFKSSPHNNFEEIYELMAIGFGKLGSFKHCIKYYKMAMQTATDAYPHLCQRLAGYKRRIASAYLHQENLNEAKKYLDEASTMFQTIDTSDDNLGYELSCCYADFGKLFYKKREISAAVHHLEKALQYDIIKFGSDFEHRDTAYRAYHLLAKIREEELNFLAAKELLTAGTKIIVTQVSPATTSY